MLDVRFSADHSHRGQTLTPPSPGHILLRPLWAVKLSETPQRDGASHLESMECQESCYGFRSSAASCRRVGAAADE